MEIKPYINNAKEHPTKQVELIAKSISRFGWQQPIKVGKDNIILAGHGRNEAYEKYKDKYPMKDRWIIDEEGKTISGEAETRKLTPKEEIAYRLADNQINALSGNDMKLVVQDLKELDTELIDLTGFDTNLIFDQDNTSKLGNLSSRFLIPPFSILDTKQGKWQDRKREWIARGISSGDGRDENLLNFSSLTTLSNAAKGTSIFDPVLCEVMYKWFNIEGGSILDPFCGGSVRGIVATELGHKYTGFDIRQEQIDANYSNLKEITNKSDIIPEWICSDAKELDKYVKEDVDMIFSCPPYFDLEVYSENEKDLSNMNYADFKEIYKEIIMKSVAKLKEDRFAIFVITDIRDTKSGLYLDFVEFTRQCFEENGCNLYNHLILANAIGTAPLRANKLMRNRKMVRTHQNVLVFYKGNPKNIQNNFEVIEFEGDELSPEDF